MYSYFTRLSTVLLFTSLMVGQQKQSKPQSKPAVEHPAAAHSANDAPLPAGLPSEETVNAFMQQMFGYNQGVTWKITDIRPAAADGISQVNLLLGNQQGQQLTTIYVTADGKHALVGDMIPFGAEPFAPAQAELQNANGISRGPSNSPVTIVEFSDLQCPHCKEAQPTIKKLLADEPSAHFVFQQFPLPSHNWAEKAASYADCVGRANAEAFWKFIDATYNAQSEITEANADEKLTGIANSSGAKGSDIAACAAKPDTKARVDKSLALGKAVDVTGTPTLFINGRKISSVNGIPYDMLKSIVEFASKGGK